MTATLKRNLKILLPPGHVTHVFDSCCRLVHNPVKDKFYDSLICDSQSGIDLGLDDEC